MLLILGNALVNDVKYYYAWLVGATPASDASGALPVFGIILAGIPVYLIWRWIGAKRRG